MRGRFGLVRRVPARQALELIYHAERIAPLSKTPLALRGPLSTYRSTVSSVRSVIQAARQRGLIHEWGPTGKAIARRQALFVTPPVLARLSTPWGGGDSKEEALRQAALATLDTFIEGSAPIGQLFKTISKRRGICEMLVLSPRPGVRILGAFASEEAFIGTGLYLRSEIAFRHEPTGGREWREIQDETDERLNEAVATLQRVVPRALS